MRPALLRLLKRPSALSLIDSLILCPPAIEHLRIDLEKRCLRCQSSNSQPSTPEPAESRVVKKDEHSKPSTKPLKFTVHPIEKQRPESENRCLLDENQDRKLGVQLESLDYESDVGHTRDIGTRLVDSPAHRNDFGLWLELLKYRRRHYGNAGTQQIWEGLMRRVGGLQIPVDGETADTLWQTFVDCGLEREGFLNEIADYALGLWNETGQRWPKLYQSIVSWYVKRGKPSQAVHWHKRLQYPHLSDPNDIAQCFTSYISEYMKTPNNLLARRIAFEQICQHTDGHQVYGQVISALIATGKPRDLLQMHEFLIARGDHPRSLEELQPLLDFAEAFISSSSTKEMLWQYSRERFGSAETVDSTSSRPEEAGKFDSEEHLEDPGFNDGFGARVFATKALTFDMILSGLKTFRVTSIGPQSLREMARKAGGSHDVLEKLDILEQNNISVGDSIFARLLRRLATENRQAHLSELINSDQHHDVFEDSETQIALLKSHYIAGDWRQYNLTLEVLKELLGDGLDLMSIHVRKHIAAGETTLAAGVVTDMLMKGFTPNEYSVTFMVNYLFGPRRPGRRPVQQVNLRSRHDLASVFRYLQGLSQAGANVPLKLWDELLKRYGMTDRWDELRACCLWLARRYPGYSASSSHSATAARAPRGDCLTLQRIFHRHMQQAIISWGFIIQPSKLKSYHMAGRHDERLVPFVRGIMLLRELQNRGLIVQSAPVYRACLKRLLILYGPFYWSRRRNRALRAVNPYTIERVISDINIAGNPRLISGVPRNNAECPGNPRLTLFGSATPGWRVPNVSAAADLSPRIAQV
ncbi:hypothetical protein ASPVEDRAFT_59747 [Aspergillus versicolor CBS 583.65]|uniref:Pentatricopeptide repeat domain-containing protein n=1 Tax=Aspergillus versicolor CBS 583.65 TaxID=1036611 RepID=A0A1L9PA32_ASPVE|nr:uncharacterized protein ASPVEDRAFT_59747 [Aspergillus versicolor CBS 583.65]OJI98356.1 hypothetical protein ASPVEDRAFT_59747 [Aspergillus versicolor CBS 583.65]